MRNFYIGFLTYAPLLLFQIKNNFPALSPAWGTQDPGSGAKPVHSPLVPGLVITGCINVNSQRPDDRFPFRVLGPGIFKII